MKKTPFRFIAEIERLDACELNSLGYYQGFPCHLGHTIRDSKEHWCYFCVKKIISNICGFDLNYQHSYYKVRYQELWARINVGPMDKCWTTSFPNYRKNFPSYRTATSSRWSENVSVHKLIYQCAWGDIGKNFVTRTCKNNNCFNPLHMQSQWNVNSAPKTITPFCTEFVYEKLMLCGSREAHNLDIDEILKKSYKAPIANPKSHVYKDVEE